MGDQNGKTNKQINNMGFRLKSGNRTSFKQMGGTEVSPAKDMKTGSYKQSFESSSKKSPAYQKVNKGGEAQDQDKIFDEKGNHIGNWVNDKKVMFNDKPIKDKSLTPEQIKRIEDAGKSIGKGIKKGANKLREQGVYEVIPSKKDVKKKKIYDLLREPIGGKKKKSPAKQTKDTFADGTKKSARDKFNDKETAIEQRKADRKDDQRNPKPNFKIHSKEVDLHKKSGFGPISVNSNLTRKQRAISRAEMKGIDSKSPYWYKINGKKVSHAQYKAYENKPGGDEPGKQTNDPDAMGHRARIAKDRAKLKTKK